MEGGLELAVYLLLYTIDTAVTASELAVDFFWALWSSSFSICHCFFFFSDLFFCVRFFCCVLFSSALTPFFSFVLLRILLYAAMGFADVMIYCVFSFPA